jgi:hypothetical protein
LPFGRLWYGRAEDAVGYAKFYSRSQRGEVRVFDTAGAENPFVQKTQVERAFPDYYFNAC